MCLFHIMTTKVNEQQMVILLATLVGSHVWEKTENMILGQADFQVRFYHWTVMIEVPPA